MFLRKSFLSAVFIVCLVFSGLGSVALSANYPLEITQPQPNLTTANRYYKAYPGLEYKVPIGVFGGEYPFTYSLTTAPSGMTINSSTGVITWPNPTATGSPHSVTARVVDSESTEDTVSWTVTVTTSGFVFLDIVNGSPSGAGTISDPKQNMVDIGGSTYSDITVGTYNDYFVYFRGGTYDPAGYLNNSGQQIQLEWRGSYKPIVWLEYPGESVVIDHNRRTQGAFFDMVDSNNDDLFIHGIRFQDMLNHAIRMMANRQVFFEAEFQNLGPGRDGDNSSFLMFASAQQTGAHDYTFIKDCTFNNLNIGAFLKLYSVWKAVIEGNTLSNGSGAPLEGIAVKAYNSYIDIRGNTIQNIAEHAIGGNWNYDNNFEIRFNKIQDANNNFVNDIYGALTINYNDTAGPVNIYRNTIEGTVTVRFASSDDGPFRLYNNVIVNENSGTLSGSHINYSQVNDMSRIIIGSGSTANLTGYPSSNIIDANGNLTANYTSYIGTHGHLTGEVQAISIPRSFRLRNN